MTANHYKILGVAPGAEDAVIRAAYRTLMRMYHPDKNDDPHAQARAREITAAFAILGNRERRAAYDAREAIPLAPGQPWTTAAPRSPPMRNLGLASIAIAIAVSLVFALPRSRPEPEPEALRNLAAYRDIAHARPAPSPVAAPAKPVAEPAAAVPPPVADAAANVPLPAPARNAVAEPSAPRTLPAPAPAEDRAGVLQAAAFRGDRQADSQRRPQGRPCTKG